ncbi:MAG: ADP-ribose pyrophosphatase, partial [Butyricicoccus sp.]
FSTEITHLYAARGLHQGQAHLDEGEFLELCRIPVCELEQCIANGQVRDAKTVAAMYYARLKGLLEERR